MLAYQDLMDYSERLMRKAIRDLPDGDYGARTIIDGFLDDPEQSRRDLPIAVTLKVRGDEITVDLTGTAPQVSDKPINMPLEGTVDCAIWLTLRSILLDSAIYGNVPQNAGLTRPIHIVAPRGTLVNPIFPAPVIARFCPGNALADTVMKALAQAVPKQVSAGIGNLRCIAFTGLHEGKHWVHMEILEGSYGGRYGMDGMDAVDTLYANTRNNPIEDIEFAFAYPREPLRITPRSARQRQVARRHRIDPRIHLSGGRRLFRRGRGAQISALGLQRRRRGLNIFAFAAPSVRRRHRDAVESALSQCEGG